MTIKNGGFVMDNKEIILSKIAEILNRIGFFLKSNSEFKSRLKCVGLGEYFEKYSDYLIPYYYNNGHTCKFENPNEEYDVFLGLDSNNLPNNTKVKFLHYEQQLYCFLLATPTFMSVQN